MALASSGTISIGGSTANRSINLELGRSATTSSNLNETALRTLAERSSGSISLSHFHGKSDNLWSFTVTNGYAQDNWCMLKSCTTIYLHGYANYWNGNVTGGPLYQANGYGSVTDTTCNFKSGATIKALSWRYELIGTLVFELAGNQTNAGFSTMTIGSTSFNRTDANFQYISALNTTQWSWETDALGTGGNNNPFGSSGTTRSVVFN